MPIEIIVTKCYNNMDEIVNLCEIFKNVGELNVILYFLVHFKNVFLKKFFIYFIHCFHLFKVYYKQYNFIFLNICLKLD